MVKAICGIFLVAVGCSMVHGQSAIVNSTLNDIKNFQFSSVTTTTRGFNTLLMDVYGHFYRSQGALRAARQSLFASASRFPYHTLTPETRKNLIALLSTLATTYIDPTVDFLQKDSVLRFFNYAKDESTPIERTFKVIAPQLVEIGAAVVTNSNDNCIRRENINRRLPNEYNGILTAINDCTRNSSATYRSPINEFTRVHFVALPLITRIGAELMVCANNGANRETCVVKFLKTYCNDASDESCKTGSTILAVKNQAETMVNTTQEKYDECLKIAETKAPSVAPFVENLSKCVRNLSDEEAITEESIDNDVN